MRGRRRGGAPGRRGHRRGTPGPQGWKRREGSSPGASGGSPTGFGLLPPAPQHVPRVCICRVSPQKPMPRDASPDLCPRPACCGFGEGGGEHAGVVSTRVSTWGQLRGRGAGAGGHVHPEQSSSRGVTAAPPARSEATAPADTPPGAGRPILWGAGAPSTTAVRRSGGPGVGQGLSGTKWALGERVTEARPRLVLCRAAPICTRFSSGGGSLKCSFQWSKNMGAAPFAHLPSFLGGRGRSCPERAAGPVSSEHKGSH